MFVKVEGQMDDETKKMISKAITTTSNTNGNIYTTYVNGGWGIVFGEIPDSTKFIPEKVIFNPPATICYFPDGTKTVVKCADDEEFVEEVGVMACIIKKLFESRNKFKKLVRDAYRQPDKKDQWG